MIIGIVGAIVGQVHEVRSHPQGTRDWLADVALDNSAAPHQIVFGGARRLTGGELVAVAPPGSRAVVLSPDGVKQRKKMRVRRYRGERSHGMLCSFDELGWVRGGPNEVAVLRHLSVGDSLDDLPADRRSEVAENWVRVIVAEKRVRTTLTERFDPAEALCI